ncbi:hypothetical protein Prudu_1441S000400 [Prunus dulcis]|uniref:Uncharacterized protein n=1 Tax=Prunus dulcis TaxID=3755 RepID=A0A5H2XWP6_PRUDU|nr:hypothetical protein Prudu_1441S000400 [Prunus dulcis]
MVKVSRGVGYPALRQTPYVVLVVPTLSGVETGPIRGVGCTGIWGDIVIVWYGRTWRKLSGVLTGPILGFGCIGVSWKNYVWLDLSGRVRRQPKIGSDLLVGPEIEVIILENVQFTGETVELFGRKSRSLVSEPDIGVMSGNSQDPP